MPDIADLHTHTRCSDGALTPGELVARAKGEGIRILSVTDHDSVDGISDAVEFGVKLNVTVLPGVELSVTLEHRELHLLGYCFDPEDAQLRKCLKALRDNRLQRAEKIVQKLNVLKIPLKLESVLERAGTGVVCRPHIADAMLAQQFVATYHEVFQKYIGTGGPAYEKKPELPLETAVKIVSKAGGLTFLAHPGTNFTQKEFLNIIKSGIDGIETVHPSHNAQVQKFYKGITNQFCLLESGGSDFHGGLHSDEKNFGQFGIPLQAVEQMQQRLSQSK